MRYADRITFIKNGEGSYYDPEKGEYVIDEDKTDTVPCNLSSMKIDRTQELFGSMDRSITVARLQRPYTKEYDRVEIDGEPFTIQGKFSPRRRSVFYLEGS
ncbi:hypothetical protein J18TS1_12560 [Oceanobacillus oncorhynchi subsp. incaldanensis]|uniref:hypothetical protein n=1 Tax=Oceanobacillus oncorhynchi TaxID=545501 RepID=UPI001B289317|nr:hypothetical protein [Oceanobacillus oncorhynchi]GIO18156.1 hypothetical protein J18TS1_12560 [Oceanobacillus oncorhynchi subsp. incaldanensis]